MRVWTVQPLVVWERLQEMGTLYVDQDCFPYGGYVPWQYQWVACRLQERLPSGNGGLPWWAYCQKPDLRWVRHHRPLDQPQVRIELELEAVLTFPGWAWDVIYSGQFLAFTKREQELWETAMRQSVPDEDLWPLPQPWRDELEASWLQLFAPDLPTHGWTDMANEALPYNEAVFETLCLRDIRCVTHFVGRSCRSCA